MTEQQQHLSQLIQQRATLDQQIAQNREMFWKIQGAIEYLTQIGVTLPEQTDEESENTENETDEA